MHASPRSSKRNPPAGARPGTLVIPANSPPPRIRVIEFSADSLQERAIDDVTELETPPPADSRRWIDVQGLGDEDTIRTLGRIFGLHPLTLEDVTNVPSRPKTEDHANYQVMVTRMIRFCPEHDGLIIEQVSVIWNQDFVLTIQEQSGDILDPIRTRLREGGGRPIRTNTLDYLAYAIVDCLVDGFYPVLERYSDHLEALESTVINDTRPETLESINLVRRELATLRRAIWPQREAVNALVRDGSPFVGETVRPYFRDTYDHCVQAVEVLESYRELATGLLNTYLSCVANRTNEIMKVLTIMASIFIPLTFMAGIYGMNFDAMPELRLPWAYPALWVLMLATAGGMLLYFRRLGWLGRPADADADQSPMA